MFLPFPAEADKSEKKKRREVCGMDDDGMGGLEWLFAQRKEENKNN